MHPAKPMHLPVRWGQTRSWKLPTSQGLSRPHCLASGKGKKGGSREWSVCLPQPPGTRPACLSLSKGNWGAPASNKILPWGCDRDQPQGSPSRASIAAFPCRDWEETQGRAQSKEGKGGFAQLWERCRVAGSHRTALSRMEWAARRQKRSPRAWEGGLERNAPPTHSKEPQCHVGALGRMGWLQGQLGLPGLGCKCPPFPLQTHSCPTPSHAPQTHFLVRHKDHKCCMTPLRRKLQDRRTQTAD